MCIRDSYRAAHEFDRADAGIDDVAEDRFSALVRHASVAVRDRADVHAVDHGVRLRVGEYSKRPVQQRRCGQGPDRKLPEVTSRIPHTPSSSPVIVTGYSRRYNPLAMFNWMWFAPIGVLLAATIVAAQQPA